MVDLLNELILNWTRWLRHVMFIFKTLYFRYKRNLSQRQLLKDDIGQSESFICNGESLKSYIDHSSGSGSGIPFLVSVIYII